MRIDIQLPKGRAGLGKIRVVDGAIMILEGACLGRADDTLAKKAGNPQRDPLRRSGDTPTGEYKGVLQSTLWLPARSYGIYQVILLVPVSGQALASHQPLTAGKYGRTGLAIHSGDENPKLTWWQGLRPTEGCIRIPINTHRDLVHALKSRSLAAVPVTISEF